MSIEGRSLEQNLSQEAGGELDSQESRINPRVGANDDKHEEVNRMEPESMLALIVTPAFPHVFALTYTGCPPKCMPTLNNYESSVY